MTSFLRFAELCQKIESIGSSLEKTDLVATFLNEIDEEELSIVSSLVMGTVFPLSSEMELGVGTSILYEALSRASGCSTDQIMEMLRKTGDPGEVALLVIEKHKQPTFTAFLGSEQLSIVNVHQRFIEIAKATGKGSQSVKVKNLQYIFSEATPLEAQYIARLAIEDMRIGVGEGIVRDSIAKAFGQPSELVERAYNHSNDLGLVARKAKLGELSKLEIMINHPIKMMLAQLGETIPAALGDIGPSAIEWKFDGARVQIHKNGDSLRIYSRRLENVTRSLPEIAKAVRDHVTAETAILDGEAVAIGEDGRPRPFQDILKRFRRKHQVAKAAALIPLTINLFDIMFLDGESLIDRKFSERRKLLEKIADPEIVTDQIITDDPDLVERTYQEALSAGHEGVMLKSPNSPYAPGKRGKNWLKIKPVMESLDLVVIGAKWGEGRRAKLLGSYRLACHDPQTGDLVDIGWVGTGITDDMLTELTELFEDLIIVSRVGMEVELRPEVVFEIAYEEIQKSPNYSSGYALRFPRLIAVRDDKSLEEADTLDRVTSLYMRQKGTGAQLG
jgi:DNA ligase-1